MVEASPGIPIPGQPIVDPMANPNDTSRARSYPHQHEIHGQPYGHSQSVPHLPRSVGASPAPGAYGAPPSGEGLPQGLPRGGSSGGPTVMAMANATNGGSSMGSGHPETQAGSSQQQEHQFAPVQGTGPKPIRRRMRMITSCLECRRRKLKCNKSQPCTNCTKFSRQCVYLSPKLDEASQLRLTEIKEKVGSLERQLERDVAKSSSRGFYQQRTIADDIEEGDEEDRDLEISSLVALDLTYEDDADGADVIDLGVQVGRMRITERIGGLNRPRLSEEIQTGLTVCNAQSSSSLDQLSAGGLPQAGGTMGPDANEEPNVPDFLRPGATYISPTSGIFFGQVVESPPLIKFLPSPDAGDKLLQRYYQAVHPIARCVHWPSFETQYATFWDDVHRNIEPRPSIQAIVFAAWFNASVSMDETAIQQSFGYNVSKRDLVERMKIGAEAALSKANFLRSTRVETMQAFVMYMIPLCRAEVSRAHSVLVGAAVRMAECMGLHRDGEAYGLNPLETHVRRLVWHQLCFLDVRTCEAQGPKPAIRKEDYDTKLPLNCEESELTLAVGTPQPAENWTSTLLTLVRFEINQMMRIIWVDRRKLENRKMTLSAVLTKIEEFRRRMFEKYNPFLDSRVPIQQYTRLVMHLLLLRLHAMVLHPYHSNAMSQMPERLNSILIMSGIVIIEIAIELETNPAYREWSWYIGAYQQFQIALLLATELFYRPKTRESDRIWQCLDYVFNMGNVDLSRDVKIRLILGEIQGKTAVYSGMRKMRAPTNVTKSVPGRYVVHPDEAMHGLQRLAFSQPEPSMPPPQYPQQQSMPAPSMLQYSAGVEGAQQLKSDPENVPQGMMPPPPLPTGMLGAVLPPQLTQFGLAGPPLPGMVFGGVSNGEVLWGPPPNPDSPENSSDGGSVMGQQQPSGSGMPMLSQANILENIDWESLDAFFPNDPQTGGIDFAGFVDPGLGLTWHG